MRIEIAKTNAKMVNFNPNSELHGAERAPVGYIRLRMSVPNQILDQLHRTLRPALFFHDTENPGNDLADKAMEGNPDYLPHLRFPNLAAPMRWKDAMEGGSLTIHRGVSKKSNLTFSDIKLDDIQFTPKAGGTVEMSFRVRVKHDEEHGGKLTMLHQQDVEISVEAPKADDEVQTTIPGAEKA